MADPIVTPPHAPLTTPHPLPTTVDLNPPMVGTASPFERVDGQNRDLILEAIRAWARGPLINWAGEWQDSLIEWLGDTKNWLDGWNAETVRYVTASIAEFDQTVEAAVQAVINSSITVQDPVIAGALGNAASATREMSDRLYLRPRNAPLDGTRTILIGDSITITGTDGIKGQSHTTWGFWESGGRLYQEASVAASGQRSDQQLTALTTYWNSNPNTPPTLAILNVGANNLGQGFSLSAFMSDIDAIVKLNRAHGCDTAIGTITPRSGPATPVAPSVLNGSWNKALRDYALANNLPLIDYWAAVADPMTGEWRAGEFNPADGVHPNYKATRRMADELKRVLYPLLKEPIERGQIAGMTARVKNDGGLLPAPIFTQAGDPLTMGVTTATGGWAVVPDAAAPGGFAAELIAVNPAANCDFMERALKADGGWLGGDRLLMEATFRIVSSKDIEPDFPGSGVRLSIVQVGGGPSYAVFCFGQFMPTAEYQTVRFPFTPDPAATAIYVYAQYIKPAENITTDEIRARVGSMQLYNLTRMGIN